VRISGKSIFTGTATHKEINTLDVKQRVTAHKVVSEAVSNGDYSLDPTLESYDVFLARIHNSNNEARKIYSAASNADPFAASKMRAAASSMWDRNLSEFQQRFLQRGTF